MPETMTCPSMAGVTTTFMLVAGAASRRSPSSRPSAWSFLSARRLRRRRRAGGRLRRGPRRPPPTVLPLIPGRRREPELALGEVVRPHGDLLLALPLERHHLVRELEAVLVDL